MARYPFSPALLDALPEELAELFRGLEDTLLDEICSRVSLKDRLNEVTIQAIRALRSHGIDTREIEDAIRKTAGVSEKKLDDLFSDVIARNQKYYTGVIDMVGLTKPDVLVDASTIAAIRAQTLDELRNITRSMGFLVDAGRTMLPPARAYQWALDSAVMQIQSGAIGYNQAIKSAVQQLAGGLKVVNYESGHVDQIDVAVRRAVMTGVNQICDQYTNQSADFLDTRYFEVSAHSGARDKPGTSPWSSHKDWQGKVYYYSENGEADPLGLYDDLVGTTGYGYVDGLTGANCRHHKYAFIPGVSERTYTDEQLSHIDDGLGCTFDGKTYTAYEATQMQRRVERQIIAQKRLRNAFKEAGLSEDAEAANVKLRRLNAKYKDFSKAAGLPEQPERLKVLYGSKLTDDKRFAPLMEYGGAWKVTDKFSERQYVVDVGKPIISGARQHFWDNFDMKADRRSLNLETAQSIIDNSKLTLYQTDRETLKFLADNGYVMLNMKKQVVTAVPEKLRKKYRDYLEGK